VRAAVSQVRYIGIYSYFTVNPDFSSESFHYHLNINQIQIFYNTFPEAGFVNLVDLFTILDLTSAFAVIIPGVVLLTLIRGVKVASLRNMTIMLAAFGILHGFYHLSYLTPYYDYAPFLDLATALILVMLGMYYSNRIVAFSLFLLALPETATYLVPVSLIIAFMLFARLAIVSKSIRSLQTQLSIFIIVWIAAELLRSLLLLNIISASTSLQVLGLEIHTAAMIAFGVFMLSRYYRAATSSSNTTPEWLAKENAVPPKRDGGKNQP